MRIYIAGGWAERLLIQQYRDKLAASGVYLTHDWTLDEQSAVGTEDDRKHDPEEARRRAEADVQGIMLADAFWFMVPGYRGGRGAWVEFGIAIGREGMPIIVTGSEAAASIFTSLSGLYRYETHEEGFKRLVELERSGYGRRR